MTVLEDFNEQVEQLKAKNVHDLTAMVEQQEGNSLQRGIAAFLLQRKEAQLVSLFELVKQEKIELAKYFLTHISTFAPQDGYNLLIELGRSKVRFFTTLSGNALAHSQIPKLFPVYADRLILSIGADNKKLAYQVNDRLLFYVKEDTSLSHETKGKELERHFQRKNEIKALPIKKEKK